MPQTPSPHQQLKDLLANSQWDDAQALWLDLAAQPAQPPEFLLLLLQDFAAAGKPELTAELADLLAPTLRDTGKPHEWLYCLKLRAGAKHPDKSVRTDLLAAYQQLHATDPRLKTIIAAIDFDNPRTPLLPAIAKVDTLLALTANSYCQHKSWGIGRIKNFDTALNRIVCQFPHNPDHAMQLAYAAESITPLPADHIEVRKRTDLPALQQLATTDPLALLRLVLLSHRRAATADQIAADLTGTVLTADQWKKWWDNTKRLAKRDSHFVIPARKTEPVQLHAAPVAQQDELLQTFRDAPSLHQKTAAARQLLKTVADIPTPDLLLQEFYDGLTAAITKAPSSASDRLEAAFTLEDLLTHHQAPAGSLPTLAVEILTTTRDLPTLLDGISNGSQKRALAKLRQAAPDRLPQFINQLPAKLLDQIAAELAPLAGALAQHIQNQTASLELLVWLCRQSTSTRPPAWFDAVPRAPLLAAVLNGVENANTRSETKKLRDCLLGDEALLPELLRDSSADLIRDLARQVLASTTLDELDRRLLMGRLIKEFPFVQDLLVSKTVKEQPLIVSRASFEKRRAELEELVQKKIPQNSKEIGVARSYGDLRENFEFKAAKDMQKILMRRRAELEVLLTRAAPTDFTDVQCATVQIGTSVTVTELPAGATHVYHVLGAWDSDPARGIISYPAALAQTLLNKPVGTIVAATGETGATQLRIDHIAKVPDAILQAL